MPKEPTRFIELEATVEAGAYAAGDMLGQRLDFTGALYESGLGGVLQSVVITALNTSTPTIDVVFFDDVFQGATAATDNDPSSFTDPDLSGKCLGFVTVNSWSAFANNAVGQGEPVGKPIEVKNTPGTLYAQMVTRTAVTPGATNAYTIKLGFLKDYS